VTNTDESRSSSDTVNNQTGSETDAENDQTGSDSDTDNQTESDSDVDNDQTEGRHIMRFNSSQALNVGNREVRVRVRRVRVRARERDRSRSPLNAIQAQPAKNIKTGREQTYNRNAVYRWVQDARNTMTRWARTAQAAISGPAASTCVCNICYDDYREIRESQRQIMSTTCGHIFCCVCIDKSLERFESCPVCRRGLNQNQLYPLFF